MTSHQNGPKKLGFTSSSKSKRRKYFQYLFLTKKKKNLSMRNLPVTSQIRIKSQYVQEIMVLKGQRKQDHKLNVNIEQKMT